MRFFEKLVVAYFFLGHPVRAARAGHIFAAPMAVCFIGPYRTVCSFGVDRNLGVGENLKHACHQARLHGSRHIRNGIIRTNI